jgi:hypothetical protein
LASVVPLAGRGMPRDLASCSSKVVWPRD